MTAITTKAQLLSTDADGKVAVRDTEVTLIPYYAWNHRGAGIMDVWMADAIEGLNDK